MLSLGHILISDLVISNLFRHSKYDFTLFGHTFLTTKVFCMRYVYTKLVFAQKDMIAISYMHSYSSFLYI